MRAYVAVGSNLGDRWGRLAQAARALRAAPGVAVVRASRVWDAAPIGPPQPRYLNAVLELETTRTPRSLLGLLREVERAAGRTRDVHWGARTLDLDLLLHGGPRGPGAGPHRPAPRDGGSAASCWRRSPSCARRLLVPGAGRLGVAPARGVAGARSSPVGGIRCRRTMRFLLRLGLLALIAVGCCGSRLGQRPPRRDHLLDRPRRERLAGPHRPRRAPPPRRPAPASPSGRGPGRGRVPSASAPCRSRRITSCPFQKGESDRGTSSVPGVANGEHGDAPEHQHRLGQEVVGRRDAGHGEGHRGERMGVHDRADVGPGRVGREVHEQLGRRAPPAADLPAQQVDDRELGGPEVALAGPRGGHQQSIRPQPAGDVSLAGADEAAVVQAAADLDEVAAEAGLGGLRHDGGV